MSQVARVSSPQRHGAGWHVPSGAGRGVYFVQVNEDDMRRCTCPACVYHGCKRARLCKHIRRILNLKRGVAMV
jgi:hypothetical protein